MKAKALVARRPAETVTPVAMAIAMLVGGYIGMDTNQIGLLAIIVAFVPAGVTWLVGLIRS